MRHLTLGFILLLAAPADAQITLDFEDGLDTWTTQGTAFLNQPIDTRAPHTSDFVRIPIGGDYWRDLPFPLGSSGTHLVRSSEAGTGTLISAALRPSPATAYFSVLVSGAPVTHARVELWSGHERLWQIGGYGHDQLRQEVFEIPPAARGRTLHIRLVDEATDDHLTVDRIMLTEARPLPYRVPVWGLADYHTHVMNHIAFGGLNGVRTVWGVPGGAIADYEHDRRLVERDLPRCISGHGGGPSAETFINGAEGQLRPHKGLAQLLDLFTGLFFPGYFWRHDRHGAPGFDAFPAFNHGLHHQMHVTQIHRAWQGGLRLMTVIAVHNKGAEFVTSKLAGGVTSPTSERAVLDAQVCAMRQFAELNRSWMEIAYRPADARRIIVTGKLAIVLAVEMDQLGELDGLASIEDEVSYLWDIGVRHVTPVHAVDNALGGAAVFEPVYNSLNDLLNRKLFNATPDDLTSRPPVFFDPADDDCPPAGTTPLGECVTYRLSENQSRGAILRSPATLGRRAPFLTAVKFPHYSGFHGMLNKTGLKPEGARYLRALMRRGMLIGLEHMAQRTVDGVYDVLGQAIAGSGHPECRELGPASSDDCFARAYPLVVSHAHFRRLSFPASQVEGHRPSEYEVSDRQADMLRRTGGFAGQFVVEEPVELPADVPPPAFANDCAGSSKSFGYSLEYARQKLGGSGVGLASDFTIIHGTAPRFGRYACWSGRPAAGMDPKSREADQYKTKAQANGVRYAGLTSPRSVKVGTNAPLQPYRMSRRTFDFNVDGLANYGLLPDLLQDVTNLGLSAGARAALFSSAEAFLETWEKAERLSGVGSGSFVPKMLPCETACRGLCPASANAGAPAKR